MSARTADTGCHLRQASCRRRPGLLRLQALQACSNQSAPRCSLWCSLTGRCLCKIGRRTALHQCSSRATELGRPAASSRPGPRYLSGAAGTPPPPPPRDARCPCRVWQARNAAQQQGPCVDHAGQLQAVAVLSRLPAPPKQGTACIPAEGQGFEISEGWAGVAVGFSICMPGKGCPGCWAAAACLTVCGPCCWPSCWLLPLPAPESKA